jgi:cytochrome c5
MPRFADEALGKGRGIWMGTCRNCHLLGISEAPAVNDYAAWQPRIEKGKPALYQSALNGIKGADGAFRMPPRGGNPQLKNEQVRLAVDYMVASVRQLAGER